jgi:hypothetical protein
MDFSNIDPVYIILGGLAVVAAFVFLMAALWRWILKIDQQIKNQEAIIHLLSLQCKIQGATEEDIQVAVPAP